MARKLRVQYPGAIYHAMNRGDHSEALSRVAHDPELFVATLAEACAKTDSQTTMTLAWIAQHLSMALLATSPIASGTIVDEIMRLCGTDTPRSKSAD